MPLEKLKELSRLVGENEWGSAVDLSADLAERFPQDQRVLRARAIVLRRACAADEAEAFLSDVLARLPRLAWAHAQLGLVLQYRRHARAIRHFRAAVELDPTTRDYRLSLALALAKTGDGEELEEAYQLIRPILAGAKGWPVQDLHIAYFVLKSVCAFDELDELGPALDLGRRWAEAGDHTALFMLLSESRAERDRLELVELHRVAADAMARQALKGQQTDA